AMLFRSNVNAVISEFEQPEKMLNQIILDMRSQLVKAKQQVAAAIADEKRLEDQTRQELKEAEDWERRAMLAVQQNQDDLAKQALVRRSEHISRGDQLNVTWQAHKQETDRLKDSLRTLNDNIEEANRKKNLLLAKQRRADAQKRINETMSHISEKSAFEAFARMEEKIESNERKVRASAEIEEAFSGDKLANDFKRLEAAGSNQSAEILLLQLKQKMGVLPAGAANNKALGAGRQAEEESVEVEEIHDENK
ncbi:MAG: PspA/IM30 family protein, partial [Gemmatimonadaceae bacterium]